MDSLDDLGLTGFTDPSTSPDNSSSPRPILSGLRQGSSQTQHPDISSTPVSSRPQDTDTTAPLPPLPLFNAEPSIPQLGTLNNAQDTSVAPGSMEHGWFQAHLQPRRSSEFNPAAQGTFTVPTAEPSSSLPPLLDFPVLEPLDRGSYTRGPSVGPVAGPSRK